MKDTNTKYSSKGNQGKSERTKVTITGATGVMGFRTLNEFIKYPEEFEIRVLARDSKKNRKKLAPFIEKNGVKVVWGDLMNAEDVEKAIGDSEYVLHIGGMVSPLADHYPEKTLEVNVGAAENIVNAIKKRDDRDNVKLVYIGSVAQTAMRHEPHHWGRTGDPIMAAQFDNYAVSKIKAELIIAESGLKYWVSLRQSGILHNGLIYKGSDPISFHVPLRGVLEWATVEDSARLMVGVCRRDVPESFWKNFYNIGSGKNFRLTNYEFEVLLLKSLGCPPPEKCFEAKWFATRNFHGEWYEDSDKLEEIIPFREDITAEDYFNRLAGEMPWWMNLAPLAPALLVKTAMWAVSRYRKLGTLHWLSGHDDEKRINAFFGGREAQSKIPDWKHFDLSRPSATPVSLEHGYDESKSIDSMSAEELRQAAEFRGLKCISEDVSEVDPDTSLELECTCGHRFQMRPRTLLLGGHWCPKCECKPENYGDIAKHNPFVRQVWADSNCADDPK
ncbi:MAG: NAD(P)-dependent oxidoreductase [Muribaculaceae bacterium]|nr:NAD(P)-dependent oxidoreductase [Muribaculaceae bacterium]